MAEDGTAYVVKLLQNMNTPISISQLSLVEVVSALAKRQRLGDISWNDFQVAEAEFLAHCQSDYEIILFENRIVDEAIALFHQYPLKAYDAIQLATALQVTQLFGGKNLVFMGADKQLNKIAEQEGLTVEDPAEEEQNNT